MASRLARSRGYRTKEIPTRGFSWLLLVHRGAALPDFGWKLHVSISTVSAHQQMAAVVNALISEEAVFKIPSSLDGVIAINSGQAGITQLGKTVTVYPASDDDLVRISRRLRATDFRSGPRPPSDLVVEGAVGQYIRWGAFGGSRVRWTRLGRPYVEIQNALGNWVEDVREPSIPATPISGPLASYAAIDLSVADEPIAVDKMTIVPVGRLSHGARSRVDVAMRLPSVEPCVLKRARPKVAEDLDGNCAEKRLANEARMLSRAAASGVTPLILGFDRDQNALVMSDEPGDPINYLEGEAGLERLIAATKALGSLHAAGVVHRDAKLANAIWHPDRGVVWLDFELAALVGEPKPIAAGTHGYIPPEGTGAPAHPSYDIFAVGASLAKWCLGIDSSRLPLKSAVPRIHELLRGSGQKTAEVLYSSFTDPDPKLRPSADVAADQLAEAKRNLLNERRSQKGFQATRTSRRWASGVAARALPAVAGFRAPEIGSWRNNHLFSDVTCTGLNIGSTGILLGLMHIAAGGNIDPDLGQWISETAEALAREPFDGPNRGFFTGSSGAALVLTVAGSRLRKPAYTERAVDLFRQLAKIDDGECDLFSGDAGVLWAGVHMARIVGPDSMLAILRPVADRLHARVSVREGTLGWAATPAYDPEGKLFLGAAHGSSGIALGLSAWADLVGDEGVEAGQLAHQVYVSVYNHALAGGQSNTPETVEGSYRPAQYWCHGAAGFLWCLLQSFPNDPKLRPAIIWAMTALREKSMDVDLPSMCHGLAGMLELWSMIRQWSISHNLEAEERAGSDICNAIAFNLRCVEQSVGRARIWSAEDPAEFTPDLWVGFLGPVVALDRYARNQLDSMLSSTALVQLATPSLKGNRDER